MKNEASAILLQSKMISYKKNKERLLAKRFFPFYVTKIKHVIKVVYHINPNTSFLLVTKLLSIAIRKKLSSNAIAFYKKGIKQKIKIDGATFYTYTYGNGPLILMLHGWCSNGARWRVYVNKLVDSGYKVMVVDAPGHGTAPGRFLSIFLYTKGIKTILESEVKWHTVITHSIASIVAITAIGNSKKTHHPNKFIMMNTFANATNILEKFSRCLGIPQKVVEGSKEKLSKHIYFPLQEFSIHKHYNTINSQGLLIYDIEDRVVSKTEAEDIIRNFKPLQIIKTKGLGHNLKSIEVVKEVVDFVKSESKNKIELKLKNA